MENEFNDINSNLLPEEERDNNSKKGKNEELKIERLNENDTSYEESKKVMLIGDANVGKTSILKRLLNNSFNENIKHSKTLEHHNLVMKINSYILRLQIWDTVGHEKLDAVTLNHYMSTDVAIFIYSIDNLDSFNTITNCLEELNNKLRDKEKLIIKILIGNKNDLSDKRKVNIQDGGDFANKNEFALFHEISCKEMDDKNNNSNINEIVEKIGKMFYAKYTFNKTMLNSDSFNYKAPTTVLKSGENVQKKKRKCCTC